MDRLFRFSDYDLFGFVASGLAGLAAIDATVGSSFIVGANWSASQATLILLAAYVLGHVIAMFASTVIERFACDKVLGHPVDRLLRPGGEGVARGVLSSLLGDYLTPLEPDQRDRLERKKRHSGESLFQRAFEVAKRDPFAMARLQTFLIVYGFARNLAFVAAVTAIVAAFHGVPSNVAPVSREVLLASALLLAAVMFSRYLKYRRSYVKEVLLTFLAVDKSRGAKA